MKCKVLLVVDVGCSVRCYPIGWVVLDLDHPPFAKGVARGYFNQKVYVERKRDFNKSGNAGYGDRDMSVTYYTKADLDAFVSYEKDRMMVEINMLLGAAYHALRSYQLGNDGPELAKEVADKIEIWMAERMKEKLAKP